MSGVITLRRYLIRTALAAGIGVVPLAAYISFQEGLSAAFILISIILYGAVLGVLISLINYRKYITPMKDIIAAIEDISKGNLTNRLIEEKANELKPIAISFNKMCEELEGVIKKVHNTSLLLSEHSKRLYENVKNVSQTTSVVVNTIEQVSTGAHNTLRGAEESTSAIEEIAIGIQKIADGGQFISNKSMRAVDNALKGNELAQGAYKEMQIISTFANQSAEIVRQLGERSNEIGRFVEVITGIADQTNLLAINAAIEAARVGEDGKGFAVVAEEIRKLSDQSKNSASQISEVIQKIQEGTAGAIFSMESMTEEVTKGTGIVKQNADIFADISSEIQSVTNLIQEAAAISEQISASIEEVAASVAENSKIANEAADNSSEVVQMAEQQDLSVEAIFNSIKQLNDMTEDLKSAVSKFQVN